MKKRKTTKEKWVSAFILFFLFSQENLVSAEPIKIRVGHFPTVTHAPALIGRARGHFERKMGKEVSLDWKIFNAGPLAIEALFAGEIDLLYTGPNPAINGFVRSEGEALRIVAGVASGGSAFVVRRGSGIRRFKDIQGRRLATPQIGNSQDVALRHLMAKEGLAARSQGGAVDIFRLSGGDQLRALSRGEVDGIWTVEPWVSRLVQEAKGEILFEEKELWPEGGYATALLVVRKKFLEEYPNWVQKWVQAHAEVTDWMNRHPEEAKQILNEELKRETGQSLSSPSLTLCFRRITFTLDPMESSVRESAARAFALGYLGKKKPDLSRLYELSFLKRLREDEPNAAFS